MGTSFSAESNLVYLAMRDNVAKFWCTYTMASFAGLLIELNCVTEQSLGLWEGLHQIINGDVWSQLKEPPLTLSDINNRMILFVDHFCYLKLEEKKSLAFNDLFTAWPVFPENRLCKLWCNIYCNVSAVLVRTPTKTWRFHAGCFCVYCHGRRAGCIDINSM